MHAYDLARLAGAIAVRAAARRRAIHAARRQGVRARSGLHGHRGCERGDRPCGHHGRPRTAIGEATTDVLLEAAHFTPDAVAGRARRLGLFTDAAQRFERGVDPTLPALALERATALILEIAGGEAGPSQITRAAGSRQTRCGVGRACAATAWRACSGAHVPDEEVRIGARGDQRGRRADARGLARAQAAASLRCAHRGGFDRGGRATARLRQHRGESCDRAAGRGLSPPSLRYRRIDC